MRLEARTNTESKTAVSAKSVDRRSEVMTLAHKCSKKHTEMTFSQCLIWAWKTVKETYIVTWSDNSVTVEGFLPSDTDLAKKMDKANMAKMRKDILTLQARAAAKRAV